MKVLRLHGLHSVHVNLMIVILLHEHVNVVAALVIKLVGHLRGLNAMQAGGGLLVVNHLLTELLLHLGRLMCGTHGVECLLHMMRLLKILMNHGHVLLSLTILFCFATVDAAAKKPTLLLRSDTCGVHVLYLGAWTSNVQLVKVHVELLVSLLVFHVHLHFLFLGRLRLILVRS
jgi:hypothetical protein